MRLKQTVLAASHDQIETDGTGREPFEIYSTCPQSRDSNSSAYLKQIVDAAQWSETAGCTGILIYADNSIVDPWLVGQVVLENTEHLCPLIAVQPVYMHPYTVAKIVSSYAFMYNRRVCLNFIAGGFKDDLYALDDPTSHDDRYDRLSEYALVIKRLLESADPVSSEGRYYRVRNLKLLPPLPPELAPGMLMSGSSRAGIATARAVGATSIIYPRPAGEELDTGETCLRRGARVGIIARSESEEAWRIAHQRFPDDRRGRAMHQMAIAKSDSLWHKQLSGHRDEANIHESPYWLRPFETYKSFCPYLVGSFEQVAEYLSAYMIKGYSTYILDIPYSFDDLECAVSVLAQARARSMNPAVNLSVGK
jgi:alkanesulfonate monooxygenase